MAEILTAHPTEPPSLYVNEPLSNQMGPVGVRSSMVNAQGLKLATYWWCVPCNMLLPRAPLARMFLYTTLD